jgi:Ca2+-binding EF-hand superfamily protein
MGRFLAGSVAALLLVAAGLVWWGARDEGNRAALIAQPLPAPKGDELPDAGDPNAFGKPPPMPPQADARTREQKRFDRYDRNRDDTILRSEMMASRAAAFRKLDKDGNNLLSFEEWAVATSTRFARADGNKDGKLTRTEFATTAPKPKPKPAISPQECACDED